MVTCVWMAGSLFIECILSVGELCILYEKLVT
jgi:hypothetical protein